MEIPKIKNTITKTRNVINGSNRLHRPHKRMSELEKISVEIIHIETEDKKC